MLTPTSYIVLGLLETLGPSTPYELKQAVARSIGNFWSLPHSQIYAEPPRLATAGLLRERREQSGRRRRTFEILAKGRKALEAWKNEPTDLLPELRDPALLKIYFGADPDDLAEVQVEAHQAKLEEYLAFKVLIEGGPSMRGPLTTLEAGIAHEKVWIEYWNRLRS